MNEHEKLLKLAELMAWKVAVSDEYLKVDKFGNGVFTPFNPYTRGQDGLSQFAAILLKFPQVMMQFAFDKEKDRWLGTVDGDLFHGEPTQENILDEILRMHASAGST